MFEILGVAKSPLEKELKFMEKSIYFSEHPVVEAD
jgi:hypothetical protein